MPCRTDTCGFCGKPECCGGCQGWFEKFDTAGALCDLITELSLEWTLRPEVKRWYAEHRRREKKVKP